MLFGAILPARMPAIAVIVIHAQKAVAAQNQIRTPNKNT